MNAVGYLRVSTGEQAKKYSLAAQREEIEAHAAAQGIQVVDWFEDHSSGSKLIERDGLMELLDRAQNGIDLVVATEADRISRDTLQFGWVATHLQMQGVELRMVNERPAKTPTEKAFQKMQAVFAEFETELRQWRINRGRAEARRQGRFMSRPPLGYGISRGQLVVDPETSGEVVDIFRRYAAGEAMMAIARSRGRGRRTIAYVLKNRFYVDPELHGTHEVFLDEKLFEAAHKRMGSNGQGQP